MSDLDGNPEDQFSRVTAHILQHFFLKLISDMNLAQYERSPEITGFLPMRKQRHQHLCFRYMDSTVPLLSKSNFLPLAFFSDCTEWLV